MQTFSVQPVSHFQRYLRTAIFGLIIFALTYLFTHSQNIPNALNKSVADTSIILMGLSMILSSIYYFFNFLSFTLIYRRQLGLIGFAFALVHLWLSLALFWKLFQVETWQQGTYWSALTGILAIIIFGIMSLISNQFSARLLGGKTWKMVFRTGYIAMLFILAHVILLKFVRWQTWYSQGMKTLPSMSLIVTVIIVIFLIIRVLLSVSLKKKNKN